MVLIHKEPEVLGPISDALCEAGVPHYAGQAAVITSCSPASYRFSICWRCGWCCVRCQWQQRGRRRDPHFASDERLPPPPPFTPLSGLLPAVLGDLSNPEQLLWHVCRAGIQGLLSGACRCKRIKLPFTAM